jgi:Mrp family chromosome partitioning ATPase
LAGAILAPVSPGRPATLLFTHVTDLEDNAALVADLSVATSQRVTGEVIVVDADFQNPRLCHFLGAESNRALPDVLLGIANWREVVQRTKTARLSLLPGGHSAAGCCPPDMSRLGLLLDELRCHYDLVLLQAASVGHPEIGELARHSDATYLTAALGCVSRRQVRWAASVLQRSGAALLGSIVIG